MMFEVDIFNLSSLSIFSAYDSREEFTIQPYGGAHNQRGAEKVAPFDLKLDPGISNFVCKKIRHIGKRREGYLKLELYWQIDVVLVNDIGKSTKIK